MAQINWQQVNVRLVNVLHTAQVGWGKVREYVTRVEEPEWEFDTNWSPSVPTLEQAKKTQAFWDEVMEGVDAALENRGVNDDDSYWAELTESHTHYNINHGADAYHVSRPHDIYEGWIK